MSEIRTLEIRKYLKSGWTPVWISDNYGCMKSELAQLSKIQMHFNVLNPSKCDFSQDFRRCQKSELSDNRSQPCCPKSGLIQCYKVLKKQFQSRFQTTGHLYFKHCLKFKLSDNQSQPFFQNWD